MAISASYYTFLLFEIVILGLYVDVLFHYKRSRQYFNHRELFFFSSLSNNFEIAKKVLKNYLNMPTRLSFLEYVCQAFKFYFISFF